VASTSIVILAAGQGTRLKSDLAKVLHEVGGKPMVVRAVDTAAKLAPEPPVVVVGRDAEAVKETLGSKARFVLQAEQLGTGHAVMQASETLKGQGGSVLVFYSDMPLLRFETLSKLIATQAESHAAIVMLTMIADDPRGFGRIVRAADGKIQGIVEERDCTPEQKQIKELNPGVYVFDGAWLWENLARLRVQSNGEYYLTDMVKFAVDQKLSVTGIVCDEVDEVIGVNTRIHLSDAEAALKRRTNAKWMLEGVTMLDPVTTYIHEDVTIGRDTIIYPNTHIQSGCVIGAHCEIGPNSILVGSRIGDYCQVECSVVEYATLEDHVEIGPFAHLRKGAYLASGVHMGNFGEVKNARLGPQTRMGHFSYIGDAEIGMDVNIGAGTITANFDGVNKHQTVIGDQAFIGSDTILRAPVTVEANARTAAGSVVIHNVPEGQIAIGVPARNRPIQPNGSAPVDSPVEAAADSSNSQQAEEPLHGT